MRKIYCYSHSEFDNKCYESGWNDFNLPDDKAFISITGTKECQDYYLGEKEDHWFSNTSESEKILNLEFDDISDNIFIWKGHKFTGITKEQARKVIDFIELNLDCDFYIHCRAGKSRSQGIVRFILDMYPNYFEQGRPENPCTSPNYFVVSQLKRAYYEKNSIWE